MSAANNNLPAPVDKSNEPSFSHLAVDDRLKAVAGSAFVSTTPRKGARVINAPAKVKAALNFSDTLKLILSTPKNDGTTLYADLVLVALDQALRNRDAKFFEMILNRTEGKPADRAEIVLENNNKGGETPQIDLSKLTVEELQLLRKLQQKAKG